jgi:hypothetical protein
MFGSPLHRKIVNEGKCEERQQAILEDRFGSEAGELVELAAKCRCLASFWKLLR